MFKLGNRVIHPDSAFVHEGVSYPANWLRLSTPDDRRALGIEDYRDPGPIDRRFYVELDTGTNRGHNGPIPRELRLVIDEQLIVIDQWIASYLQGTDWVWVRLMETGKPVPDDIAEYRNKVREEGARLKAAVVKARDVEEVKEIVTKPKWPMKQ